MLACSAVAMARMIRGGEISSVELVEAHLARIEQINPSINAAVHVLRESALQNAALADQELAAGKSCGPLHGVPFSIKDSIDVAGVRSTAGTVGFRNAPAAVRDASVVARLREAAGIPLCKTNLPDLLFSFESDNLVFGRTNNPYNPSRTPGGSSGGEAALIASGGSPLGLGSDCLGSVRVPAAFCGIASIKPTCGRLPRTGHVPPPGGWVEKLWQIGPMARWTEDLVLAIRLLAGEDGGDLACPPVGVLETEDLRGLRAAFFLDNGIAACDPAVSETVLAAAKHLADAGVCMDESRPPCIEQSYELEMSILGADGGDGIDAYLRSIGSERVHPLLTNFVERFRRFRGSAAQLAGYWSHWDHFRTEMTRFFDRYDVVLCPVYTRAALEHGASAVEDNFKGFSYTMTWSVAGFPAATVRCGENDGLPINVQVVSKPWRELTALAVCRQLELAFGGWRPPDSTRSISLEPAASIQ